MRKMEIVGIAIVIVVGDLLWPNSGSTPVSSSSTDSHEASTSDYNGYDYSSHQPTYGSAPQNEGSQVGGDNVLDAPDKARKLGGRLRPAGK
jgi:hypothetical protein